MTSPRPSLGGLHGTAQRRPLYSRVPALYFAAPPWLKSAARRWRAPRRLDAEALVARYLAHLAAVAPASRDPVPLLLTHDVDTPAGYTNLPRLLEVEEGVGLSSVTFIVTERYAWDRTTLEALQARGHCFGVHDTTHDNRLPYLPVARIRERIAAAQAALGDLDCGAFRVPAFLRSAALYEGMAARVTFDFSTSDWALLWPHPDDGLQSPWPVRHRGIVCVPTTLPRDGEMIALGLPPARWIDLWQRKMTQLWRVGAPAVLLTHPDPGFTDSRERIEAYAAILGWARDRAMFELRPPLDALRDLERRTETEIG